MRVLNEHPVTTSAEKDTDGKNREDMFQDLRSKAGFDRPRLTEYLRPEKSSLLALRVSLLYALFGLAWILFSDTVAEYSGLIGLDEHTVQTMKGFLFVALTALALYVLLAAAERRELSLSSRLRDAIDATRDGLWRWDIPNDDIFVTPGGDAELGWAAARTITNLQGWRAATHPDDWPQIQLLLERLKQDGTGNWVIEQRMQTSDGGWHWYEIKGTVLDRLADGTVAVMEGTYHSIEKLKLTQTALERTNGALRILVAAYDAITYSHTGPEAMTALVRYIADVSDCPVVWIGEAMDDEKKSIRPIACGGPASDLPRRMQLHWGESGHDDPAGISLKTGKPHLLSDLSQGGLAPEQADLLHRNGIRSAVSIPILTKDGRRFVLTIAGNEPEQFSEEDAATYQTISKVLELILDSVDVRVRFVQSEIARLEIAERLQKAGLGAIAALATVIEKRDPYTAGHQHRVADLAVAIGRKLALGDDRLEGLRIGAWIHDIGKIGVPTEILSKPGRLDTEEIALIRRHAQIGYDIVKSIDFGWPIEKIVYQHHERMDGSGYPQGLKGEEIALEARIVAVADVIESMGTNRPYREKIPWQVLLDELESGRSSRYDPKVVDAAMDILRNDAQAFGLNPQGAG